MYRIDVGKGKGGRLVFEECLIMKCLEGLKVCIKFFLEVVFLKKFFICFEVYSILNKLFFVVCIFIWDSSVW